MLFYMAFVTPSGFEPKSSEPESEILSIELWGLIISERCLSLLAGGTKIAKICYLQRACRLFYSGLFAIPLINVDHEVALVRLFLLFLFFRKNFKG